MTDSEPVRAAFLQRIDPERVEGYRELHEDVPDFVTETMERAGVTDFRLFLREEIAVCVMDVADPDTYVEVMGAEERMDEWERRANEYKSDGIDVDGDSEDMIPWMEEIWRFTPEE